MRKSFSIAAATLIAFAGLVGGWIAVTTFFATASEVKSDIRLAVQRQDHNLEKLQLELVGVLQEQQGYVETKTREARVIHLQQRIESYQFQVQYYRNQLLKEPGSLTIQADLSLAQQYLARAKAALHELEGR